MSRLTILCGLPGSGKTTVAKRLMSATGCIRMCPDDWILAAGIDPWDEPTRALVESAQWTLSQQLLLGGHDVVLEWGTWARAERDVLRDWCRRHDVRVSLVHLDVPASTLRERLTARNQRPGETPIPPDSIDGWIAGPWQPPNQDELARFDPIELPPPHFRSRPWQVDDIPFLWEVLYQSIHVPQGQPPAPRSVLEAPDIAHYLRDFGRLPGDDAEIVVDEAGTRVAGAYCRRLPADDPGYGYVADDVPELGMAVVLGSRRKGLGRLVLTALLERNPAMSLSVDLDNHGARALYESLGFAHVADEGTAATMVRRGS